MIAVPSMAGNRHITAGPAITLRPLAERDVWSFYEWKQVLAAAGVTRTAILPAQQEIDGRFEDMELWLLARAQAEGTAPRWLED